MKKTFLMRLALFFIFLSVLFSACVPNKKYVYLQKGDVNQRGLPKDSVVRRYTIPDFEYKIQPFDALYIRFESLTEEEFDFLSGTQASVAGGGGQGFLVNSELVDEQGEISFPGVGKIEVEGMNVFQIQDTLQMIASYYLESPVVKVRLVNFRFTLLGEVNQEGTVTSLNHRISLPEAIGLAGGLGELADRTNVKIIRQNGSEAQVAYVDLLDEDLINSPYYYINQNDVVVIPALRQRPFRRYFGQNVGLFLSAVSVVLLVINLTK